MRTKFFLICSFAAVMTVACGEKTPPPPAPKEFTFTLNPGSGGTATLTIDGEDVAKDAAGKSVATVAMGTGLTLTADADDGSMFKEWVPTGFTLAKATDNPVTFMMSASNISVAPLFDIDPNYDPGVVIGGIKWATRNVDAPGCFAATTEDYGMLYQWGVRLGWSTSDPAVNSDGGTTGVVWIDASNAPEVDGWEAEYDPCPEGWRLPTRDEMMIFNEDSADITFEAIGLKPDYSFEGMKFTETATGNSIYFPAAGVRLGGEELMDVGFSGNYWTANEDSDGGVSIDACYMCFYDSFISNSGPGNEVTDSKNNACSLRCVAAE